MDITSSEIQILGVPFHVGPILLALGTSLSDVVMLVGTVDVVFGSVDLYLHPSSTSRTTRC
jgi:hypothetical protein